MKPLSMIPHLHLVHTSNMVFTTRKKFLNATFWASFFFAALATAAPTSMSLTNREDYMYQPGECYSHLIQYQKASFWPNSFHILGTNQCTDNPRRHTVPHPRRHQRLHRAGPRSRRSRRRRPARISNNRAAPRSHHPHREPR